MGSTPRVACYLAELDDLSNDVLGRLGLAGTTLAADDAALARLFGLHKLHRCVSYCEDVRREFALVLAAMHHLVSLGVERQWPVWVDSDKDVADIGVDLSLIHI